MTTKICFEQRPKQEQISVLVIAFHTAMGLIIAFKFIKPIGFF
jgi:hypothetical protein